MNHEKREKRTTDQERPRTEHIKAGSSNHNPNQNPNAKQNINPKSASESEPES